MGFKDIWTGSDRRARTGFVVGLLLILALTGGLGYWALAQDYQVLFSDLNGQDASAMVAELDRMKVPYQLEDGGATILVAKDAVYKTRLKLMGKNLPLHGTVGFEIFNDTDFGMTEFAQKVNYQRALQGELTRTILALEEIQAARVHLAFPEATLFKKTQGRTKASVTVTMKSGMSLSRGQVQGIQRLVAASVPDIEVADVTVVDQKGIALTGMAGDGPGEVLSARLEAKKQTEDYFARKVAEVLEKAFGPGQGIVSVDVLLNFDQVKITAEEVLPAKGANSEQASAGVIVRERQSVREPGEGSAADAGTSLSQTEIDYQNGRRVEQIVTTPGSLRRISVGVVVPNAVDSQRLERIRDVVSMAVGLNKERGDTISVYSLDQLSSNPPGHTEAVAEQEPVVAAEPTPAVVQQTRGRITEVALAVIGLLFAIVAILLFRRQRVPAQAEPVAAPLPESDRQVLLNNVRQWIDAGARPQLLEK